MIDIFNYGFIIRGLGAGVVIGIIAPLIGVFLVLRRYSQIADTISHVSLAGIAIGLLLKVNPMITAIITTVLSSVAIERLRISKKVPGDSALSIFLSGSLAIAIILISHTRNASIGLFNYLFGSIATVTQSDVYLITILGLFVVATIIAFYKELVYITIDEEAARVSGIPTKFINILFIILVAFSISLSIPIVGALLITALIVIPAITALQFRKSFKKTIFIAESISIFSVIFGVISSFYLNLSSGGTIVITTIIIFIITIFLKKNKITKILHLF
ncbi:MAG: metal ABC transporter permease [Candidatus Levybacteria bacterium]|nr:metal ABC transporter permease [Candidatus Levybacteria bacterium]MSU26206.1 metal ABC transporter permease [Candidatus Levybacteria bacterium]